VSEGRRSGGLELKKKGVVIEVVPGNRPTRCGERETRASGYDTADVRDWRHFGIGSVRVWLRNAPRRVECLGYEVRVKRVPWAAPGSLFTLAFEEILANLTQGTDRTKAARLMGIAWQTVGSIVDRVVERCLDPAGSRAFVRSAWTSSAIASVIDTSRWSSITRGIAWNAPATGAAQRCSRRSSSYWGPRSGRAPIACRSI